MELAGPKWLDSAKGILFQRCPSPNKKSPTRGFRLKGPGVWKMTNGAAGLITCGCWTGLAKWASYGRFFVLTYIGIVSGLAKPTAHPNRWSCWAH